MNKIKQILKRLLFVAIFPLAWSLIGICFMVATVLRPLGSPPQFDIVIKQNKPKKEEE